jgi:hypothetical protein
MWRQARRGAIAEVVCICDVYIRTAYITFKVERKGRPNIPAGSVLGSGTYPRVANKRFKMVGTLSATELKMRCKRTEFIFPVTNGELQATMHGTCTMNCTSSTLTALRSWS